MKKLLLLIVLLIFYVFGFSQVKKVDSSPKKIVVLNTDSLAKAAVINYVGEFLNRNITFKPTFQLQHFEKQTKETTYRDSLWPSDSIEIKTILTGYTIKYDLYSAEEKVDEITFHVSPDFRVLDSGLTSLNYAVQLANKELTSIVDAKAKVANEYPDSEWKSIKLMRGKINHYTLSGYKVGDFLTYYYFDGICKTCSYQIIRIQFDAETGKVASELKIKTD
tara:strand:- start:2064 stop:2726 length:663 start_codon:yes stop_codon:yes gene_type:complete